MSSGDDSLPQPRAGLGQRVPPPVLVFGGIVSVQLGAAFAKGLVVELGAAGTVLLRVASAALLLGALFGRQPLRLSRRQLGMVIVSCWAGYILLSQRVGRAVPGSAGLTVAMAVAAVVLMPVGVAGAGARLLEPDTVLLGTAVGLLSSAIPYALEMEALRRLSARAFGILLSLEPAVGAVVGLVVLRETLRPRELGGIALVVVASAGVTHAASQPGGGAP